VHGSSRAAARPSALPSWVATVALNLSRKGFRRVLVERRLRHRIRSPHVAPAPTGEIVDLQRAFASLPRRQREAAVLRYVLEMSTHEVASALRLDEGTVKSHLSRARAKLARALETSDTEEFRDATA
jgi:RNA polymerase sigma-70 factor (ECF subfamily)